MKRVVPLALALFLLAGYGVAEGLWTKRWVPVKEVDQAVERLKQVPLVVGDWEGLDQELPPEQVKKAEMSGYLLRRYVKRGTGETANVMIVCGRARPTSQHPPELCYSGAGYALNNEKSRLTVKTGGKDAPAVFWVGDFQKTNADSEPLRIYWAWNNAGEWIASDFPRMQFANTPFLYKMYVVHPMARRTESMADDPTIEFLDKLVPVLHKSLFAPV